MISKILKSILFLLVFALPLSMASCSGDKDGELCQVSVKSGEGGIAFVSASKVVSGSEVTLEASPDEGYEFKNWTVNGTVVSSKNPFTTTITTNTTFTANFEEETSGGEGEGEGEGEGDDPSEGDNGEFVDLGLSVKWATCNVGANSPEEFGSYFAWGETTTKEEYSWATYKYCEGTAFTLTKYYNDKKYGTTPDYKWTLETADDAATANLEGEWRMPTEKEIEELVNNCTWEWTTQNEVVGYKVTSKENSNYIFLPMAGRQTETGVEGNGVEGYYSSSSLSETNYNNRYILLKESKQVITGGLRCNGFSIRAVCE